MTVTSRKKIRGYARKLKQLSQWKDFILNYSFESKDAPHVFHMYLPPFSWYNLKNPPENFTRKILETFFEILKKLQENKRIRDLNLVSHIWLYNPRFFLSSVIVGTTEAYEKMERSMGAQEIKEIPPNLIDRVFNTNLWKKGNDVNFSSDNPNSDSPVWQKHIQGDIWVSNF
jgi:hypothetical protein